MIMEDDFNNFFDDQRQPEPQHTPVYHTPEPKHHGSKTNITAILCIAIAVVMCVLVIVNVIVLATMKTAIADKYAATMSAQMKEQYEQAIKDSLADTDIIDDVKDSATKQVIDAMDATIGEIANNYASSVARLYMYTSSQATPGRDRAQGLATGFLITDTDESGTLQRYLVTNAHCVRYVKATSTGGIGGFWGIGGGITTYSWESYGKIVGIFEGSSVYYTLEIVAYGSYTDSDYPTVAAENNGQPDLAILRVKNTQPSNTDHPSLKLASSDSFITRGTPVALIGNPEGMGTTNSITSGTVSNTEITQESWGAGTFIMTDAAVNSGNSGGPMLNSSGIVIGVVESKLVSDNIDNMGFALSAQTLRDFIEWASQKDNNVMKSNLNINCKYV